MFTFQLDGLGMNLDNDEESDKIESSEENFLKVVKNKKIDSFLFLDDVLDKSKNPNFKAKRKLY